MNHFSLFNKLDYFDYYRSDKLCSIAFIHRKFINISTSKSKNSSKSSLKNDDQQFANTASTSSSASTGGGGGGAAAAGTTTTTISLSTTANQSGQQHQQQPPPTPPPSSSTTISTSSTSGSSKEKEKKELSSSRQKKFNRHFQQVSQDERVINYFSCALVSDILLQGHLYITENYFAFYSNVFGFVTKLLIPTTSVVKISKERTAKIIPNAVGVATADERHVFGSFMSREAAYRLMLSVWKPVEPSESLTTDASLVNSTIANTTTAATAAAAVTTIKSSKSKNNEQQQPPVQRLLLPPDVEVSECSIEDDSSSAISGNETPPRDMHESTTSTDASHTIGGGGGGGGGGGRHKVLTTQQNTGAAAAAASASVNISGKSNEFSMCNTNHYHQHQPNIRNIKNTATNQSSTSTNNNNTPFMMDERFAGTILAAPITSNKMMTNTNRHGYDVQQYSYSFLYLSVVVSVLLALMSVFLFYRINNFVGGGDVGGIGNSISGSTLDEHQNNFMNIKFKSSHDDGDENYNLDLYTKVLTWRKEMQSKGIDEAHQILNSNLAQISRVRESLETLSLMIDEKQSINLPETTTETSFTGLKSDPTI